jgi:hypothetical protein
MGLKRQRRGELGRVEDIEESSRKDSSVDEMSDDIAQRRHYHSSRWMRRHRDHSSRDSSRGSSRGRVSINVSQRQRDRVRSREPNALKACCVQSSEGDGVREERAGMDHRTSSCSSRGNHRSDSSRSRSRRWDRRD